MYAQLKPEEIINIKGVDLVLELLEISNRGVCGKHRQCSRQRYVAAGNVHEANTFVSSFLWATGRVHFKVQDGCVISAPFVQYHGEGASRSDTSMQVIQNVQYIAAQGVKEIVRRDQSGDFGNGTEVIEGNKLEK